MIEIPTKLGPARIIESIEELPRLNPTNLYADAETTSFDDNEKGVHPYLGHRACGWAVTCDDESGAWYAPIRHRDAKWNLPLDPVLEWFQDLLRRSKRWINHLVKFDAHFAKVDGVDFGDLPLVCTNWRAKMIDSDRFGHELKPLCREWLGLPMEEEELVQAYLAGIPMNNRRTCQDYGRVPGDILGRYACMDVIGNRALEKWLVEHMEPDQKDLWETEVKLTSVLWDMEYEGLKVDKQAVLIEQRNCLRAMVMAGDEVKGLTGVELRDSNQCAFDILINQLGLPILAYGDVRKDGSRGPSFDKDAMLLYSGHPQVVSDERNKRIVDCIRTYREESRFLGLYVKSFQEKIDENDMIHPTYNQVVRTGRMSSRDPNSQQMNSRAMQLIIPKDGEAILCADASQMEFRIITHYIKDDDAIAAYNDDPDTDFHMWVAGLCQMKRSPAKTMNFLMAYGGGKKRATAQLMSNEDLVNEVIAEIRESGSDNRPELIEAACRARASEAYETYHLNLPGLRLASQKASRLARKRGWIRNAYGRRRHLSPRGAHKAFNSLVQGCAMDVIKERMVAISPRFNAWTKSNAIRMSANVHDAVKLDGATETLSQASVQERIKETLEETTMKFRVPFKWDMGYSENNWKEAKP